MTFANFIWRRVVVIASLLAMVFPVVALAQSDQLGSETSSIGSDQDVQIRGRVSSFDGSFGLVVRDEQGFLDNVTLHGGTIINPTGLTLAPGMIVSVIGYNAGPSIAANEIDTPYTVYGGTPFFEGHPWTFFGAGVALGVFFASTTWWHGDVFHGPYRFIGGRRFWAHVDMARIYRGGRFVGRNYVADLRHGGWSGHGDRRVLGAYEHHPGIAAHGVSNVDRPHAVTIHSRPVDVHGRPLDANVRSVEAHATGAHGFGSHGTASQQRMTRPEANRAAPPAKSNKKT